jgi:hypothetical protein
LGCETGKAYASEIKMLNQILNKVDFIKGEREERNKTL